MKGASILKTIQVKNVRSLVDTGNVPLAPITILVGENSSGKSTFLRTLPLIKQSISKRTDGPLLWAGDSDDYVDFGSFNETVTNNTAKSITFSFKFDTPCFRIPRFLVFDSFHSIWDDYYNKKDSLCYSITISQYKGHEYVSDLEVTINQTKFGFVFSSSSNKGKIFVDQIPFAGSKRKMNDNNNDIAKMRYEINGSIFGFHLPDIPENRNDIFPLLKIVNAMEDYTGEENEENFIHRYILMNSYAVFELLGMFLCKGYTLDQIKTLLDPNHDEMNMSNGMSVPLSMVIDKINNYIEEHAEKAETFLSFFKLMAFYGSFEKIDGYLKSYFNQVHYIAPLRATAERYYRMRNLAIDEVDYQGKNLAIFLSGLPQKRLNEFQQWTFNHFGFKVMVDKKAGHLSVKIAIHTDRGINMSDTGFGYSQILPIITQIWDLSTRTNRRQLMTPLVIAIEQPELHLHPALQAKLAEAFIACIKLARDNNYELQLVLETHSETIVNFFGRAIARGTLCNDDISVVLFNRDTNNPFTNVQITGFDKDGYLINWPIGFFAPKR